MASTQRVADSLKLALGSLVMLGVAGTDYLANLRSPTANTVAFVLYFTWPVLSVAMLCLTALFAVRDFQSRVKWQAAVALLVSVVIVGVTFARFRGWE
jgi:hypothetical protein